MLGESTSGFSRKAVAETGFSPAALARSRATATAGDETSSGDEPSSASTATATRNATSLSASASACLRTGYTVGGGGEVHFLEVMFVT